MEHRNKIVMIEIDKIHVLNPRTRNKKVFNAITENIALVGLKRPITVTPSHANIPGKDYDLVCGQGRLEAFLACGQTQIPAFVIDVSEERALIMSLVENVARRQHRAVDLLQVMSLLSKQGYSSGQIADKTGLTADYIHNILHLLKHGEERLVEAAEAGQIPLTVALKIASTPGEDMQRMLREMYDAKELNGKKLISARKLVDVRRRRGKASRDYRPGKSMSANEMLKAFRREVDRKRLLVRRAESASGHLMFVAGALRQLLGEDHFVTLLRAEGLTTMPERLSEIVSQEKIS